MVRHRVGIVIPALNESATISTVVKAALAYGSPIVIDDGSTDDTASLASEAGAIVVSHVRNRGYDEALNSGFEQAAASDCEIVITLDADGQHNPALIAAFIEKIDAGADMVIGISNHRQRLGEHLFALYTNYRFGIEDPLCGIKAYRTGIYRALGHFDSYGSIGTELMIYAARNSYKIDQLPCEVMERKGQSRFGQTLQGNFKIFRALFLAMG